MVAQWVGRTVSKSLEEICRWIPFTKEETVHVPHRQVHRFSSRTQLWAHSTMYYHTIRTVHRFPVVFVHNTVTHKEDTTKYRQGAFLTYTRRMVMSCSFFFFFFATLLIFPSSSSSFPTYPVIHPPSAVAPTFTCWPQQPHLSMYVLAFRVPYILRAKRTKGKKEDDDIASSSSLPSSSKQPSVFTLVVWCVGVENG